MNRSVRNGLAIAGMAGGLFFLGQAVASAGEGQVADANTGTDQQLDTTGSDSSGLNGSLSEATAENVHVTEGSTNVSGGDAGTNNSTVGNSIDLGAPADLGATTLSRQNGEHQNEGTSVTLTTGSVDVTQQADGAPVTDSGNIIIADTGGNQTATAHTNTTQTITSQDSERHGGNNGDGWNNNYPRQNFGSENGGSDEGGNANLSGSSAEATNIHKTDVDTNVRGGKGGTNNSDISNGIYGNTFFCPKGGCTYNFTTGNVTVNQSANGGNVNGSGNVGIGGRDQWPWCDCDKDHRPVVKHEDCPKSHEEASPAVKPAVMPTAKPMPQHSAPVSASAQPSGQLAFTGSDVSLPLTVGLLALAAGIGLTAAGRRRETRTV
jgi:hypothetical protein